jgi:hypothetical protein
VRPNGNRIEGNRRRTRARLRGERLERPFALLYETGGMRRVHLRGHANIRKRLLINASGFNLGAAHASTDWRRHAARSKGGVARFSLAFRTSLGRCARR